MVILGTVVLIIQGFLIVAKKGDENMELKLNITVGQTITVILLMAIAFAGGFLLNQPSDEQVTEYQGYTGFTEKDLNILSNLAYNTNHCERLGLISGVLPQITDNNEVYGIPICANAQGGDVK